QAWLVKPLLWAMAAAVIVHGLLTWLQKYVLLRLETKLALVTSSRFFTHILQLPAAYFGQRFSGEIGSRVMINDKVAQMVLGRLAGMVIDSMMTILYVQLQLVQNLALVHSSR